MRLNNPYCTGREGDRHARCLAQLVHRQQGAMVMFRCVACKREWPVAETEWIDELPLYGDAVVRVNYRELDRHENRWSHPVRYRFVQAAHQRPGPSELSMEVQDLPDDVATALERLLDAHEHARDPKEWRAARDHARRVLNRWRGGGDDTSSAGCPATSSTSTVGA